MELVESPIETGGKVKASIRGLSGGGSKEGGLRSDSMKGSIIYARSEES